MKYYVLGTKNNTMLEGYLEQYYEKLKNDLEELCNFFVETKKNLPLQESMQKLLSLGKKNKYFITNGDNSSIINLLYFECIKKQSQGLGEYSFYADKLQKEIDIFLSENQEQCSMNGGQTIAGTNIRLTTKDNNPYGRMDAHPDHKATGGVQGWGEASEEEWLQIYEKTFELLKQTDEGVYEELNKIITKIVPLGTAEGLHNSASYKECIGHLYMGYTIDSRRPDLNNLEAIIHESSHNKLNLIKQFDPLILNDFQEKYYSPYRPDARHISGIYLGIHAFVPVIYILMKAYAEGRIGNDGHWQEKIVLYYLKNKFSLKVLKKHGKFSQLGNEILDEVAQVMQMTDKILSKMNPDKNVIMRAKERQIEHFKDVNKNYPHLQY